MSDGFTTTGGLPGQFPERFVCYKCAGDVQVQQTGTALDNFLNHYILLKSTWNK